MGMHRARTVNGGKRGTEDRGGSGMELARHRNALRDSTGGEGEEGERVSARFL